MITIITPTYNRAHTLERLYHSLVSQTNQSFTWLIIDDGSTDSTRSLIKKTMNNSRIKIEYIHQENQGKHRALNTGIEYVLTELVTIVDSDDYLTDNAIDKIYEDWNQIGNHSVCGISYLKGNDMKTPIGEVFPSDYLLDTYLNIRINNNITGDKVEVWRADLLKKNLYPTFPAESFLGEAIVWKRISKDYKMLFRNEIIYIAEYLDDGLSKAGRELRIKNPLGGMAHAEEFMTKDIKFKIRCKNAVLYVTYGFFSEKSAYKIIKNNNNNKMLVMFLIPAGYLLHLYWTYKFLK